MIIINEKIEHQNMSGISLEGLRELLRAGSVRNVTVQGGPDGFAIVAQIGMEERVLASQRAPIRTWQRLDTVAEFLKGIGVVEFSMDLKYWEPGKQTLFKRQGSGRSSKKV